jgi:hypothetical protein
MNNKTIIVLTGEPVEKNKFIGMARKYAWVGNYNAKTYLGSVAKTLSGNNGAFSKDDDYYNFISECLKLGNKYFDYENVSTKSKIEEFYNGEFVDVVQGSMPNDDVDARKILILHGVSAKLRSELQETFPLFVIRLANSKEPSSQTAQDFVLETDLEGYEKEVIRVLEILTTEKIKGVYVE